MRADILAFKGTTFISRLIQWVTRTEVSHIAILVGENLLMETSFWGIRLRKLTDNEAPYYILRCDGLTWREHSAIVNYVMSRVDVGYDFKLFFGIGLNRIFGLNTKWNNVDRYICVELIVRAYESAGIRLLDYCEFNLIPDDLLHSKKLSKVGGVGVKL